VRVSFDSVKPSIEPIPAAVAMAEVRGFQRLRSLTRMRYGDNASFAGRPLIIEFRAIGCAPCQDHFVALNRVFAGGRIQVIGFHTADKNIEAIAAFAQERKPGYPLAVDAADDSEHAFGPLPATRMPYTILVDTAGVVVSHGDLESLLPLALALVADD
jgi:hypothetical protein